MSLQAFTALLKASTYSAGCCPDDRLSQLGRQWNLVTIDTGPYRYQWQELKDNGRLVFTINEPFQFWRYGSLFLVVDSEGKTHKFGLVTALRKQ